MPEGRCGNWRRASLEGKAGIPGPLVEVRGWQGDLPALCTHCWGLPVPILKASHALITEEGFLISPCYSLELCIQMLISFLFSFAFNWLGLHSKVKLTSDMS